MNISIMRWDEKPAPEQSEGAVLRPFGSESLKLDENEVMNGNPTLSANFQNSDFGRLLPCPRYARTGKNSFPFNSLPFCPPERKSFLLCRAKRGNQNSKSGFSSKKVRILNKGYRQRARPEARTSVFTFI